MAAPRGRMLNLGSPPVAAPLPVSFIPQMRRRGQIAGGVIRLAPRSTPSCRSPRESRAATRAQGASVKAVLLRACPSPLEREEPVARASTSAWSRARRAVSAGPSAMHLAPVHKKHQ
jgi:hypothetical protein